MEIKKLQREFDKNRTPRWFTIDGMEVLLPWNWEYEYVNIDTMEWYHCSEPNHQPIDGFKNLNALVRDGHEVELCNPFVEIDWRPINDYPSSINMDDVKEFFKEHGFNVTYSAISHQFDNWSMGYKSGYRDERNGYHLFTPCGGNPFRLSLTSLHETASDWQTTYYC